MRSPAAGEIRDLVRSRRMIEVVLNLDGTAEGDVVGANEVWPPVRDQQCAFGRPRTYAFDLGQASDRVVIGESAQLKLGEATVPETFCELTHRTCLLAGQAELVEHLRIGGCELAGIWHRAAKAFKQAPEDCRRRDHRDLLSDDFKDERAEEVERRPSLVPCPRVERRIFIDHPGEYRVSSSQIGKRGDKGLRPLRRHSLSRLLRGAAVVLHQRVPITKPIRTDKSVVRVRAPGWCSCSPRASAGGRSPGVGAHVHPGIAGRHPGDGLLVPVGVAGSGEADELAFPR